MHRVIHNKGGPESGEAEVFREAGRAPETECTGNPGGGRQSHGEDKEPDSMASPKPKQPGSCTNEQSGHAGRDGAQEEQES